MNNNIKDTNNIQCTEDVQFLQEKINYITNEIIHNENTIKSLRKNRLNIQLEIWDTCPHVWQRDPNAAFDDMYKYYCKKCGLYNSRNLYI